MIIREFILENILNDRIKLPIVTQVEEQLL